MYLSQLKLWNFRKFGSDVFNVDAPNLVVNFTKGLNVLIGENDSGKTAIIDAIKLLLRTHSYEWLKIEQEDFYKQTNKLRIEAIITDLSDEEAGHFVDFISYDLMTQPHTPYLRLFLEVNRTATRILPSEVRVGIDGEGSQLSANAKDLLKITYLKPLRDAEAELISRKNSRLSQILLGHKAFQGADEEHVLVKAARSLEDSIAKYFAGVDAADQPLDDQQGKELKAVIDILLKEFHDEQSLSHFSVGERSDIKSILEMLELSILNVKKPGLGTLNRLCMASELLHLNRPDWNGMRLALIEELEAHLHPQAQMQVIENLQKQKKVQLILTTHSPNIGSKLELQHLSICYKGNVFPMGKDYSELAPDDYIFLERFLDVTKSNLFFAKGIIIVEGWAEEILLPALAKKLEINLTGKGVSIVNVGCTAMFRYAKIFLRKEQPFLDVPVAVITDADVKPADEGIMINGQPKLALTLQTKKASYDKQSIKGYISPHWTLEYCLSRSPSLGAAFKEVAMAVHTQMTAAGFETELAEKLRIRSLDKVEIAYRLAKKIEDDMKLPAPQIDFANEDFVKYLLDAIRYAARV